MNSSVAKTACSPAASSRPGFRDQGKTLDTFDFDFNKKMNRRLVFELATGHFVAQHADGLLLGPPESAT
jgi:DNA replication protein DnaC